MKKVLKLEKIYFFTIFIFMSTIYQLSFTWQIPAGVILFFSAIFSIGVLQRYKGGFSNVAGIEVLLLLYYLYLSFITYGDFIANVVINFLYFVVTATVVLLRDDIKYKMYVFISRATSIILLISLVGWGLYLLGVSLPHTTKLSYDDGYHSYVDYYVFLLSDDLDIFPRFRSVFKEAGQLASICVLLLYANIYINKSKFDIIVLALSLILSFSLAGWVVMVLTFIVISLFRKKHRLIKILAIVTCLLPLYVISNDNKDSIVYQYIFSRLERDEDTGIAGNNRTDAYFDSKFEKFIKTDKVWFGASEELNTRDDWTYGCAGWKVFIAHNGIIGFVLINIVLVLLFFKNKTPEGFAFLFAYVLLCCIRAYFSNPYWLFIFVTAIPFFNKRLTIANNSKKYEKNL